MDTEGTSVSKNLDETVRLQSGKRKEWIREVKRRKTTWDRKWQEQRTPLVYSSAASFPGRNESSETHGRLIAKEEDSFCQMAGELELKEETEERIVC